MKTILERNNAEQIVKDGFRYAGHTTDETILCEVERDYREKGCKVRFNQNKGTFKITIWTKAHKFEKQIFCN